MMNEIMFKDADCIRDHLHIRTYKVWWFDLSEILIYNDTKVVGYSDDKSARHN